ncbi:transmembrane protein [Piptocephalis cylindrospora]|uniref:cysteine synthase n=1 Tax=Piptocephalis cylindrospora TaxID=1907219 RepID=A0A4P9Y5R4_9FUNG|nr:transmembrane protein [Piptocephalis cylindrospora]|eukprot:RKP13551.1 transmembrane protein [Piptocephalis cylindrospora]
MSFGQGLTTRSSFLYGTLLGLLGGHVILRLLYRLLPRLVPGPGQWRKPEGHGVPRVTPTILAQPLIADSVCDLVGHTPLVRIHSLSEATGCDILAKAEFLNPAGSTKDRVALAMIQEAEKKGKLVPGTASTIFEGTVGSTGISLATLARSRGYGCHIVMPDDQAKEKYELLERLGATVERVRPASIVDSNHFVHVAKRRAEEFDATSLQAYREAGGTDGQCARGYFADQFENLTNHRAHAQTTGPEIWAQTSGRLDAFVAGSGTGGTIGGVGSHLKRRAPNVRVILADPQGSGLYNRVRHGIFYASQEQEGTRKRHQVDTVVEGVGNNRLTRNFSQGEAHIDQAIRVSDAEAVRMARWLSHRDGLFIGSSTAVNCVAALRVARSMGPGHRIVTLMCDSGHRHLTKFWDDAYVEAHGLDSSIPESLSFVA